MEEQPVREPDELSESQPAKPGRISTPVSELPPSPIGIAIGDVVDGRYKILSFLGEGGMARVYKVERVYLRDTCALKIGNHRVSQRSGQRFQKEAIAARELEHPNLLRVYDFGLIADEHPYFVMDYLKGTTLAQAISQHGSLPLDTALDIFTQVCSGMTYAHEKGVIHRDIKPSNIMLVDSDGKQVVKVVDFGLAKLLDDSEIQGLTKTGEVFGSPLYMSPEQCLGLSVDGRADIYSFGCTLFEALVGAPPFIGGNALVTMMNHRADKPPSMKEAALGKEFPPALEKLMEQLLAKNPHERPATFAIVKMQLEAIKEGRQWTDHTARPSGKSFTINNKMLAAGGGIAALAALIIGAIAFAPTSTVTPKKTEPLAVATVDPLSIDPLASIKPEASRFSSIKTENGKKYRYFKFPRGVYLGDFIVQCTKKKWAAQGDLKLPAEEPLTLLARQETVRNPGILRGFAPDDLVGISFRNMLIDDNALKHIEHLKSLREIDVDVSQISDVGLVYIDMKFPKLKELCIGSSDVSAEGVTQLKILRNLDLLKAGGIPGGGKILKALKGSPYLEYLSMSDGALYDSDLEVLATIPKLKSLLLRNNKHLTDKGMAYLAKSSSLKYLDVRGCPVTAACVPVLAKCKTLTGLAINADNWSQKDREMLQAAFAGRKGRGVTTVDLEQQFFQQE